MQSAVGTTAIPGCAGTSTNIVRLKPEKHHHPPDAQNDDNVANNQRHCRLFRAETFHASEGPSCRRPAIRGSISLRRAYCETRRENRQNGNFPRPQLQELDSLPIPENRQCFRGRGGLRIFVRSLRYFPQFPMATTKIDSFRPPTTRCSGSDTSPTCLFGSKTTMYPSSACSVERYLVAT